MNMGIEQFVYQYLNYPELDVVGDVASNIDKNSKTDYIKIEKTNIQNNYDIESIDNILEEASKVRIFGLGACDLYHPIAYFSMPNQYFIYECNVFLGNERGVNVGTEYIRSQLEMNDEEKDFCRHHFYNYTRYNVFKSQIFNQEWDYIIMSFHDDMVYKIYEHKKNKNIRIVFCPGPLFGTTSVININGKERVSYEEQQEWLKNNFSEGCYITSERFLENLLFIKEHVAKKAKIVLITGPELNYFREHHPECQETLSQIKKLNEVIRAVGKKYNDKFLVVDINEIIKSREDVTNYVFHLKAETAYRLFVSVIKTLIQNQRLNKPPMLSNIILKNRQVCIYGYNRREVENAYYNLKLGSVNPEIIDNIILNDIKNQNNKYYIVVADNNNYSEIRQILIENGYQPIKDFINLKPIKYTKVWQE
jgi:hypothetical protein